jgi:hypothetical protein
VAASSRASSGGDERGKCWLSVGVWSAETENLAETRFTLLPGRRGLYAFFLPFFFCAATSLRPIRTPDRRGTKRPITMVKSRPPHLIHIGGLRSPKPLPRRICTLYALPCADLFEQFPSLEMAIVEPSLGEAYAHLQATYGAKIPFSISFLTHFFLGMTKRTIC